MSKYIKLEDAEDKMYQLWEEDTDNKINSASCFDDDRAIEALRSLPTIEVSEDCISREYLEEQLQQIEDITAMAHIDLGEEPYDETEEITMPISTVRKIFKNAPSVAPQTERLCDTCAYYGGGEVCDHPSIGEVEMGGKGDTFPWIKETPKWCPLKDEPQTEKG